MGYPRYPPSLYRAISYSSSLGVPVYVMENGMASAEDGDSRTQWINGYLEQVGSLRSDFFFTDKNLPLLSACLHLRVHVRVHLVCMSRTRA